MKHIFFIHSALTEVIANTIIAEQGIDRNNCVCILDRMSNSYIDALSIKIPFSTTTQLGGDYFRLHRNFLESWRRLREVDAFISDITHGDKFILYIPQTSYKIIRLLISHSWCVGYNFIEEGIGSYKTYDYFLKNRKYKYFKTNLQRFYGFLSYKGRLPASTYFIDFRNKKYIGNFVFNSECFGGSPGQKLLKLDKKYFPALNLDLGVPAKDVLIFDCYYYNHSISHAAYVISHVRLLQSLVAIGVKEVSFKYHPKQYNDTLSQNMNQFILNFFDHDLIFHEIPREMNIETLLAQGDRNVYLTLSSVAIYANVFGNRVNSIANWVQQIDPKFAKVIADLPESFKQSVRLL